jgi:hypothetical protein
MWRLLTLVGCVALATIVSLVPASRQAEAQTCFGTGFCIQNPAFLEYYLSRGQERTLGFPISNEFTLEGFRVQFFQRVVLQMNQGAVARLNLLDPDIMPLTRANASVFPGPDASLAASAPQVGSATYADDVVGFVRNVSPNSFNGQSVRFFDTFLGTVPPQPGASPATMTLLNLEIWGLPTSQPAADPGNGGFIYQRYQRGIMHYRSECGCTEGILIGEYFKAVLTGANLPSDLEADMQGSRYYRQYAPGLPGAVARPNQLPSTDLSGAFGDLQAPPPVTTAVPVGTATPTPAAGPRVTIQVDDDRIDSGDEIKITVIAEDAAGLSWIEWEGDADTSDNGNDNDDVDDPELKRRRFDCDGRTNCANVWTQRPTASGDFLLRARARNQDGVRSDWVTIDLRVRTRSATATPTPTATPVVTATPTPTTGVAVEGTPTLPDPPPGACQQRPNPVVSTAPISPGQLQVTVAAQTATAIPLNAVRQIAFDAPVNAVIDGFGRTGEAAAFAADLNDLPTAVTFVVRRVTAGQPTTVSFTVTDICGPWPTFVGGGPDAF